MWFWRAVSELLRDAWASVTAESFLNALGWVIGLGVVAAVVVGGAWAAWLTLTER